MLKHCYVGRRAASFPVGTFEEDDIPHQFDGTAHVTLHVLSFSINHSTGQYSTGDWNRAFFQHMEVSYTASDRLFYRGATLICILLFSSRRLLCCKRESYGKRAWEEVLTFNTRLINLKQHHEEMKNIFMTEVRRLKDLLEAKEEEERSLKEEMRRIISFNKTPTEVS